MARMTDTTTLNANLSQCVKSSMDFGVTHFYNVCSGVNTAVPWGTMDYLAAIAAIAFSVILLGIFLAFAAMFVFWVVTDL
jgi:hypothetical protein